MSIEKRAESIMICIANIYNTGGVIQNDDFKFIANQVEEIKKEIADVHPVKQGQWIWDSSPELGNPYGSYRCSECGNRMNFTEFYCCGCGARMTKDGDAE